MLLASAAQAYKSQAATLTVEPQSKAATAGADTETDTAVGPLFEPPAGGDTAVTISTPAKARRLRISGEIPTEVWQRLGRTLIPKLKAGGRPRVAVDVSLSVNNDGANGLRQEIQQILEDLKLEDKVRVDWGLGLEALVTGQQLGNRS